MRLVLLLFIHTSSPLTFPLEVFEPPTCPDTSFCEQPPSYPTSLFHDILESATYNAKYYQYFRRQDETQLRAHTEPSYICPSTRSIIYPKVARNTRRKMRFIYNLKGYQQGVPIEVCVSRSKCKFYDNVAGYRTRCKQKYMEKLLLSADSTGKPYVDRYKFPSACVCAYRKEPHFSKFTSLY